MIIEKTIEYIPDLQNTLDDLLLKYKNAYENTCSKTYGFILEIYDIEKVLSNKLSIYNGNIIVTCRLNIRSLFPKVGMKITGILMQNFPEGMILLVQNCMKTFIPYTRSGESEGRKVGDEVEFRITQIRFQKGKYDCIGQLE